ncbi:type II toxin-antitoxin system PemK/MazF family toxin [Candidatus Leptofilum sp.]|uniref:type II toxin-antitoxin system PemK/MazF family toxin n=1 Tax=Candidatus Leptofilum sp. TaxID=3241576 RepID=UPI003B59D16C
MVINQGDVFWLFTGLPSRSEPGFRRPHVVIQNNVFNHSQINTTVVCAITSNLYRAQVPGNVRLYKGEANLPKSSVVNISQLLTVDKLTLTEKIGTLSKDRVLQILAGLQLLTEPRDVV